MMKKIFLSVSLLLVSLTLYSCAALYSIDSGSMAAGHFIAGCDAENSGDLKAALEHYKKASGASIVSGDLGWVPTKCLPGSYSVQRKHLESSMIEEAYQRVEARINEHAARATEESQRLYSQAIAEAREREELANKESQRLYSQTVKYTIRGHVKNIEDKPLPNIAIVFQPWNLENSKEVGQENKTQTNNEGYFTLQVVGSGKLIVKTDEWNPFLSPVSLDVNPLINGKIEANNKNYGEKNYGKDEVIAIVPPFSPMGQAFHHIDQSYKVRDYDKIVTLGDAYLKKYGNQTGNQTSDIVLMVKNAQKAIEAQNEKKAEEKMFSAFNAILDFNKTGNYDSVISFGKDYIEQYRNIKNSRWHEIEQFVNKATKLRDEALLVQKLKAEEERKKAEEEARESAQIAEELGDTIWIMFIPTRDNDPVPLMISFYKLEFDGVNFSGFCKSVAFDIHFTEGTVTKIKNNAYEFKIVVKSDPYEPGIIFKGKILTNARYAPKSTFERTAMKEVKSKGVRFPHKITDGTMFSERGFPPISQTTFSNGRGFLMKINK